MIGSGSAFTNLWTSARAARAEANYRHFHQHPELSGAEFATATRIESELSQLGVPTFRCGTTGVVGVLENGAGPVVAYRADTDALPIAETTGLHYASTARGVIDAEPVPVMHACGHDAHIAVALALVELFSRERAWWRGTIIWIFQPAEELATGATALLNDQLWERTPRPEVLFAQHITAMPVGTVSIGRGDVMNLGDSWRVRIRGRGAHGAKPHESIDPVLIAAHTVVRLQSVVSRTVDPALPVVLTVGEIHGGAKENIIPDEVTLSLNIRTPTEAVRQDVLSTVRRIIEAEALASGAPIPTVEEISRFPRCFNDPESADLVAEALVRELGVDSVGRGLRATGSEDVGALADAIGIPLVFWMFGAYLPGRNEMPSNHTPRFAPDAREALATGVRAGFAALRNRLALPTHPVSEGTR